MIILLVLFFFQSYLKCILNYMLNLFQICLPFYFCFVFLIYNNQIYEKKFFFLPKIYSITTEGKDKRTIVSHGIAKPQGLTVFNNSLYYLDSLYENIVRVNLPNGTDSVTLEDNAVGLITMKVYSKRPCKSKLRLCDCFDFYFAVFKKLFFIQYPFSVP